MRRTAVFLNPPFRLGADFIDYPFFASLPLLTAAGYAARAGWNVRVVDGFALPGSSRWDRIEGGHWLGAGLDEFLDAMPDANADLVVLHNSPFLRSWRPSPDSDRLFRAVRDRYPGATFILADCAMVGMHYVAWDAPALLALRPEVDAILRFSGDEWFAAPDRLAALKDSRRIVDAPAESDWPNGAPAFPLFEALDARNWSAFLWRCFDDDRWANPFRVDAASRPIVFSTGCPHRCVFCSSNPGWQTTGRKPYRTVPLPVIEAWAHLLAKGLGARRLFLLDEVANLRPDFEQVLAVLDRQNLSYEIPNGLRADRLTDEAIARMKGRLGLLCVSAESGVQAHVDGPVGKRLDLAHIERVASTAAREGVPTLVHWVIGFPWETQQDVLATLDAAWRLYEKHGARPAVQFATPIPGTALHEMVEQAGLLPEGGLDIADGRLFQHRPAFRPPAVPEGWLEKARASLEQKVAASSQGKVIVNVTYECINNCEFCAVGDRPKRHLPRERIESILSEHRAAGVRSLDLDGGEPTLHPHLVSIVRHAVSLGYTQINVTTNGRRLCDRTLAADLLGSGITNLLVSLHGPDAATHDALTRVAGSFDQTVAGIRNAVAMKPAALDLGVNVTIAKGNVLRLVDLAALVDSLGVRKLNLQFLTPFGTADAPQLPPLEQAAEAVRAVIDAFRDRLAIQVVNGQFCLFPTEYERFLVGDVGKLGRTMVFVWEEEVNLFDYLGGRRERREPCAVCAKAPICEGFWVFDEVP